MQREDYKIEDDYLAVKLKRLKRKDGLVSSVYLPLRAEFCKHIVDHLRRVKGRLWTCSRVDAWKMLKSLDSKLTLHDFRRNRANRFAAKKASVWEMLSFFGWQSTETPRSYLEKQGVLGRQLSPLLLEESSSE